MMDYIVASGGAEEEEETWPKKAEKKSINLMREFPIDFR